jgi:hypothetical protein|tara:strand:- start:30 stop:455 length:426 start_codon:yes stop_codon:yes gene_type:complete
MEKKGGAGIIIVVVVIILILAGGIGAYFIFFAEKCPDGELFNPYDEVCVSENILCNLEKDCTILEGQSVTIDSLQFTLISATEQQGYDEATINVGGQGEVSLTNRDLKNSEFSFNDYLIVFEAADGDADKIMGATFEVIKA